MKKLFLLLTLLISLGVKSQCDNYQIYESFTSTLPTQGGTWASNSMIVVTTPIKTGTHAIGFNGSGDWIRTPQIANPGVLTFWHRRSGNDNAWELSIQTSPNGTTSWTTRGSVSFPAGGGSIIYTQYTLNIGSLGLTNVFIRLVDVRSSGKNERYIDDLGITSTTSTQNSLFPFLGSCSKTLNSGDFLNVSDDGGPVGPISTGYSNNVNRTLTITPSDNTKKASLQFFQMDLETDYDTLFIYNGPNTSSPILLVATGESIPSLITSSSVNGELTIRWKTDASNIGVWGGFLFEASIITPLPVELTMFDAIVYPQWNVVKWSTASEQNSSHFDLESSMDGENWRKITTITASGNSTEDIKYSFIDFNINPITYYRLQQYDIDGEFKTYGPILATRDITNKKIVKYINLMGQDINPENTNGVLIEIYDDGTMRKIIR